MLVFPLPTTRLYVTVWLWELDPGLLEVSITELSLLPLNRLFLKIIF